MLKFSMSDLNIRRLVSKLVVKQSLSNDSLDLGNVFFLPDPLGREAPYLPAIGLSEELILPWDMTLAQELTLIATVNLHETMMPEAHQFVSLSISGVFTI